jgi:transcriptional regulator with GAF, ATPase, and Fis domain
MGRQTTRGKEIDFYRALLLDMPQERSVAGVLRLSVRRLATRPQTALVRVWLLNPMDIRAACPQCRESAGDEKFLHLVASAGNPLNSPAEDWSRLNGEFSRFPVGGRKVGKIAATGKPIEIIDITENSSWIARPDWARRESIRGFLGQPLVCRGEILGVLAVFTRDRPSLKEVQWLRMVADHAAMSILNARAFEEISRLRQQLQLESDYLRQEIVEARAMGEIIGQSDTLKKVVRQIDLVAPTDANVLILGESGTGKELVAREIHKRSRRRERPLLKVNCASVPADLFESEFFGHIKGAFTGAIKDRAGRFEAADGGTLFLDEVGEIPLALQSKLLRTLQEGQFERVGEERTRQVDVRVIAATNRNLEAAVAGGRFRHDLYYRLNVFPIEIAPLRQRKEDIAPLAALFVKRAADKFNRSDLRLTRAGVLTLKRYDWPGNVRELQNVIERAVIVNRSEPLYFDLKTAYGEQQVLETATDTEQANVLTEREMRELERRNIEAALRRCGGRIYGPQGAANLLGLPPTTLSARVKNLGIKKLAISS